MLLNEIANSGCILSSFEWGAQPKRYTFIERNRLIVAFSHLLVVVEGRMPSGTFSAVNWAEQLCVDVAVVPGSIFSAESGGPHYLLSNGAMPLCSKENLIDALALTIDYSDDCHNHTDCDRGKKLRRAPLCDDERAILEAIEPTPLSVEEIAQVARKEIVSVIVLVNLLELKKLVKRLPDGRLTAVG